MNRTLATLAALVAIGSFAQAAAPASPSGCFFVSQSWTWKAPDTHTMYVKVNSGQYFRLDMASRCPTLVRPEAQLVTTFRFPSVCGALDWDLKVKDGPHSPAVPCIVNNMTRLTPTEVANMPAAFKPH